MVKFLKVIIEIDAQRPKVKIWFPGRIVKAAKDRIADREFKSSGPIAMGSAEDPASFDFFDSSHSTLHDDDDASDDEFEKEKALAEPPSKYVRILMEYRKIFNSPPLQSLFFKQKNVTQMRFHLKRPLKGSY
jgi:hypothetical protein